MCVFTAKHDDEQPLLADVDEAEPILEKLTILLMGQHGARKNTVGNAILCKNAFNYMHRYKRSYCKEENTIFGRNVTLIRVPGWSEDLSSKKNKEHLQVIKDSVLSVEGGPHVLILVVSLNTELTKTRKALKKFLGDSVDKHILPLSVDANCIEIDNVIIDRCRNHFFRCRCKNQSRKLLETVENFILHKDEIRFYPTGRRAPTPELKYQDLKNLVEGLYFHIITLEMNAAKNEAKIQKLQRLVNEKEKMLKAKKNEIKMLTANSSLEFLKKHRKELIDQVVSVQPIADQLHQFIGDHKYSLIQQAPTSHDKMRQIFDIVMKGGKKLQDEFYRSLQKEEKYLLEDLQSLND
ncbi:uncharacterized protein LOC134311945 [Trichomycterus rosablanca]|uniref:uncharacterized protein LOC134311945 n=1 Tax=Trichomycterus rosablanca TaxID=2290929 RepID=UPI002F34F099